MMSGWSIVFGCVSLALVVVALNHLIAMWTKFVKEARQADSGNLVSAPSWVGPAVKSILIIGVLLLALSLGWNAMVGVTSSRSNYKSSAEVQEHKVVRESQLPSAKELRATSAELKERSQSVHKEALASFDESMKRQAEKIKLRSVEK